MSRRLRYVPKGSMVEVTSRAIQGRFLLRPTPGLREILAGILARARELYAVKIHAVVALGNHVHALLSPSDAQQLARFMCYVNTNFSKEAGRLHNWRGTLFERRYQPIVVSDEPAAQINRLHYLLEQGCKEGLVWSPLDWPGLHCAQALIDGMPIAGIWFDRTAQWAARQRGEDASPNSHSTRYELVLDPLPCWSHHSSEWIRQRIAEMVGEIEEQTRRRHAKQGTQPLGRRGILRQNPHSRPNKIAWSAAPLFHAASKRARWELWHAYGEFLGAFREAAECLKRGDPARFPEGSFPPGLPFVGLPA